MAVSRMRNASGEEQLVYCGRGYAADTTSHRTHFQFYIGLYTVAIGPAVEMQLLKEPAYMTILSNRRNRTQQLI